MLRIIRYIILFLIIMLCLFWLQKNNVNVRAGLDKITENTTIFFKSIGDSPKVSKDLIYNQINKQDYVGPLASTTGNGIATTVKSYIKGSTEEKKTIKAKISIDGIIHYTNIERKKAGLSELIKNTKLNDSANKKVDDMFTAQYFEHTSPDGKTAADLVKSVDYKFQIVGENLALGIFNTDQMLVQAWMNSPTHRANILNPKYTEMGAAVGISEYKGQTQWMAVQHFAKPMPICAEIDQDVQEKINTEKTFLESEERELQKMAGVIESTSSESLEKNYLNNYNVKVAEYNDRLNKLRDIITEFNKTIVIYNTCVKG